MPSTIPAAFAKLRQNLEITELQSETVAKRQAAVRDAVAAELTTLTSFLAGSYMRSTMIAPLASADVDVFVILDPGYFSPNGYASLLDRVRRVLLKTYKTSKISRNGQAVTISFTDFRVDVVPGFSRKGGGYLIPDSIEQRWIETDPKNHIEKWSESNKAHGGELVPLMKMLKAWNMCHSQLLNSFHFEALTRHVLTGVTISNPWSGVRFVFEKAQPFIGQVLADPAGYPGGIGGYLDTRAKQDAVKERLEAARQRAVAAETLGSNGRISEAFDKWRIIFGDYFPAYG